MNQILVDREGTLSRDMVVSRR